MTTSPAVPTLLFGLVAAVGGYGATFLTAGVGPVVLRTWFAPRLAIAPAGQVLPAPSI